MNDMMFFKWMRDGYYLEGGVVTAPEHIEYPLVRDGQNVDLDNIFFTLKDGIYMPYHAVDAGANIVNGELKKTIEEFIPKNYPLEFIPVTVKSNEYGDIEYYIMHFKIIFDVINQKETKYIPGTNHIIKICLDSHKVNGLNIFNSQPNINDIIISNKLYKAIIKQKLNSGIEFLRIKAC